MLQQIFDRVLYEFLGHSRLSEDFAFQFFARSVILDINGFKKEFFSFDQILSACEHTSFKYAFSQNSAQIRYLHQLPRPVKKADSQSAVIILPRARGINYNLWENYSPKKPNFMKGCSETPGRFNNTRGRRGVRCQSFVKYDSPFLVPLPGNIFVGSEFFQKEGGNIGIPLPLLPQWNLKIPQCILLLEE
ncbi:hypothetical protein CDAR_282831 [Caerostris darwini]|uniref:Maturase K n=1 Tax=Caerostris darwini TaxID=1538125 RepID=A0AAV4W6T2_9ARAC|nr:hypothetical protein CDAR_282831 [Caerostris darwini]